MEVEGKRKEGGKERKKESEEGEDGEIDGDRTGCSVKVFPSLTWGEGTEWRGSVFFFLLFGFKPHCSVEGCFQWGEKWRRGEESWWMREAIKIESWGEKGEVGRKGRGLSLSRRDWPFIQMLSSVGLFLRSIWVWKDLMTGLCLFSS